ncbi:MAG: type I-MYXAN CRISPR-associated endonuclease Cas1 [Planctomycetia bacterium]|nr:type I-MYXAN CRISPR-associated endonuclease Cas1 [Planctomycetia bacterium]
MSLLNNGCALQSEHEEPLRIMALHALDYCPRLFYLEEVEEIRVADDRVYAGRALHEIVAPDNFDGKLMTQVELTGEKLGLTGKIDCLCRRNGTLIPYEHKRGKSRRIDGNPAAWSSDAIQVSAYGLLLEEARKMEVKEGRIRYHADNQTVRVPLDDTMRKTVFDLIAEGRRLRASTERPPVTPHEKRCIRCSLAAVCLPEEERLALDSSRKTLRLFPEDRQKSTVHVITAGSQISKTGESFLLTSAEGQKKHYPVADVDSFVIDGFSQITTQALQLCAVNDISVHWLTSSGSYMGTFASGTGPVQRRIRQYKALNDESIRLRLTRLLVQSKIEQTLRYILRCTRECSENNVRRPDKDIRLAVSRIRSLLHDLDKTDNVDAIRGLEGLAAKEYFGLFPHLLKENIPEEMRPQGRSRRPPKDRFNAILSYLYTLLYTTVLQSTLTVGLEPAFGFYHTPRSSTPPLVLDLMELFRLIVCDIPLIGSINRLHWNIREDFDITGEKVWLSKTGKRKAVELYERRLQDKWKHSVIGYSLSYARLIELEVRLLEKEWTGEEGLFAKFRIR